MVKITEELNETAYIDELTLIIAEHSPVGMQEIDHALSILYCYYANDRIKYHNFARKIFQFFIVITAGEGTIGDKLTSLFQFFIVITYGTAEAVLTIDEWPFNSLLLLLVANFVLGIVPLIMCFFQFFIVITQ